MPRVEIDTPGVTIRIEATEISVKDLAAEALQLYKDDGGWPQTEHKGIGFAATEKRWTADHHDINATHGGFDPVKA